MNRQIKTYSIQHCLLTTVLLLLGSRGVIHGDVTFGTPTNLGPNVNSTLHEGSFWISPDECELYFDSERSGSHGSWDIWYTIRESKEASWEPPVNLGVNINSPLGEGGPVLSSDGLELYFTVLNKPGGYGHVDIWVSRRSTEADAWDPAVNLGPGVNSSADEVCYSLSTDGLELYFADGYTVAPRSGGHGSRDIWVAKRQTTSSSWDSPVNLGSPVNTSAVEYTPFISEDGLKLFFTAEGRPGYSNSDIWVARRLSRLHPWNTPKRLGRPVSDSAWIDGVPKLSADGFTLYFYSTRPGGIGGGDLWQVPIYPNVDFNGDEQVDEMDMSILVGCWHTSDPLCNIGPTPMGDSIVDIQDMIVLSEYLEPGFGRIAHWKLDEIEGEIAFDSVGPYHADIMGEALWQSDAGTLDGALQLDGTDDYIAPALVLNPQDGPFRMTAWIQGGAPGQIIASQLPEGDTNTELLYLAVDPDDGTLMTNMVLPNMPLDSDIVITDGQWHDVGFEWDGEYRHLYVDGTEVKDEITLPAFAFDQSGWLDIGKGKQRQPDTYWSGLIDEIKVFKKGTKP